MTLLSVLAEIEMERRKQLQKWSTEHDDGHFDGALGEAASVLAWTEEVDPEDADDEDLGWAVRLKAKHHDNRRHQLIIAAALLVAEVERLDRIANRIAE